MENQGLPKKVLIVDDDRSILQALQTQLQKHQIGVQIAADLDSAMHLFNSHMFDACLIELEFEPLNGLALIQKFRAAASGNRKFSGMIIMAGQGRQNIDLNLMRELGDVELIDKPVAVIKLLPYLQRAVERKLNAEGFNQVQELVYDIYKKKKDLAGALKKLDYENHPDDLKRLEIAVDLYTQEKHHEEALSALDAAMKNHPADLMLINQKAKILYSMGKVEEAKDLYLHADQMAPQNIERVKALAQLYLSLKQPEPAVAKMNELIRLNPELKDLKFDFFRDLDNAGFQAYAIKLCQDTTQPREVVRYYNNLGVGYAKEGKGDAALAEYYTALVFYPTFRENYRILFNVALAELAKKTHESYVAAQDALLKCIKLEPKFKKAQNLLVQVEEQLAKFLQKSS